MYRDMILRHLALAERHIAEGERRLARQEELIEELTRGGHETKDARMILATMRDTQALHRDDRERILRELAE